MWSVVSVVPTPAPSGGYQFLVNLALGNQTATASVSAMALLSPDLFQANVLAATGMLPDVGTERGWMNWLRGMLGAK